MVKYIINNFKSLDKLAYKIMKYGLRVCFGICIISIFLLLIYEMFFTSPNLYYIGLSLFKLGLIFSIEFIICALVVDSIKKQLI